MTPEEERRLAERIIHDLLEFEGYIRSLEIIFNGDGVLFKWKPWIEDVTRRTESVKIFYNNLCGSTYHTNDFVNTYDMELHNLKLEIVDSITITEEEAGWLKQHRGTTTFVAIPYRIWTEEAGWLMEEHDTN